MCFVSRSKVYFDCDNAIAHFNNCLSWKVILKKNSFLNLGMIIKSIWAGVFFIWGFSYFEKSIPYAIFEFIRKFLFTPHHGACYRLLIFWVLFFSVPHFIHKEIKFRMFDLPTFQSCFKYCFYLFNKEFLQKDYCRTILAPTHLPL